MRGGGGGAPGGGVSALPPEQAASRLKLRAAPRVSASTFFIFIFILSSYGPVWAGCRV